MGLQTGEVACLLVTWDGVSAQVRTSRHTLFDEKDKLVPKVCTWLQEVNLASAFVSIAFGERSTNLVTQQSGDGENVALFIAFCGAARRSSQRKIVGHRRRCCWSGRGRT